MSEYGFGYDQSGEEPDLSETQSQQQGPKWFREGLDKLSNQVKELTAKNEALEAAQVRNQVADALKAKGYASSAAELYTGAPDKLDEWLGTHGAALAKTSAEGQEQGEEQAQQGIPVTVVPADGQEAMQRMQEAGTQGVAPPQGTDRELAAALKAANPEQFAELMRANGSQHDWSGTIS